MNLAYKIWGIALWLLVSVAWADVAGVAPPSEPEMHRLAKQYYATKGEWAGKFEIAQILQTRVVPVSDDHLIVHLKYQAAFIQAREHTSVDQRTFDFKYLNGAWQVIRMGAHQSGKL